jgi:hypothetical protein
MVENDRDRLIKLLGMLGSHFDGEVVNAARLIHKLVRNRQLEWNDLIVQIGGFRQRPKQRDLFAEEDTYDSRMEQIERCRQHATLLSAWERDFIDSIAESIQQWRRLTEKQAAVLDRIVEERLARRGL